MAGTSPRTPSRLSHSRAETLRVQHEQRYGEKDSGNNGAGADVAADAEPPAQASGPRTQRRPEADRRLERAASAGDKVIAGICRGDLPRRSRGTCRVLRRPNGGAGDVEFRAVGAARQFLDGAAIEIARREIHVAKRAAGGRALRPPG